MKDFVGKTLLVLCGTLLPIVLLELSAHLLPVRLLPSPVVTGAQLYLVKDKDLRHVIKPNIDAELTHTEFTFRLKTRLNFSDAGFRGGIQGGDTWGVALGDSFTFGAGVNQEATWVAQLAALAGKEVINLGIPGHGPTQYTRTFEKYGLQLKPKIVFYGLYTNDLKDCVVHEQWLNGRVKKQSLKRYLRQNSVTYNLLNNLFRNLKWSGKKKSRYVEVPGVNMMLIPKKLRDPYELGEEKYRLGWKLSTRQIEKAYEESRQIGARFVLLYFPSKEEAYWDFAKVTAPQFASFERSRDRLRNDVAEFCASHQILCLDLSTSLRAKGSSGEKIYFPIDIHWNEKGHRLVAEDIYKFLSEAKIL